MEKIILKASIREEKGKIACKHLRKDGFIPAVVYKGGKEATPIFVNNKELWHAMHTEAGENAIITLDISGDKKNSQKTVIVKETQSHPVRDELLHVDFSEISLTEKIKVNVPVHLKGEAAGVKDEDGVLNQVLWELEVECMPMSIPESIEVNVEELMIGDAVHIKDVAPPEGVVILDDPEQVIAGVNPPQAEEEPEGEEEGAGEEGEEPEVIKKGKKEEEGEEGSEEAAEEAPDKE